MTAKDYLGQLWLLNEEIISKEEELYELRVKAESCSSPKLSDMPKAHNNEDQLANTIAKIINLQNQINNKIDELIDLHDVITRQIDDMQNPQFRLILRQRYVLYWGWLAIADNLGYSVQRCYQLHGNALTAFADKYLKTLE